MSVTRPLSLRYANEALGEIWAGFSLIVFRPSTVFDAMS